MLSQLWGGAASAIVALTMCFYNPPLFLGTPDLSAAAICALPLAISVTGWRELLGACVGLSVAFVAAHFFIVALQFEHPITTFYWFWYQAEALPEASAAVAIWLVVLSVVSLAAKWLWRVSAAAIVVAFVALSNLGSLVGAVSAAAGTNLPTPEPDIIIADCLIPPFGEGMTGYSMLVVLIVFEILVAVGIADAVNRKLEAV